ncbi:MAG: cyclase family protein [Micrococcales bacterium]|nr:cyclase family protein [Micrococcales bacterium]
MDLTLPLGEEFPCTWPGHIPYQQKTFNYFAESGPDEARLMSGCGPYQTRWLMLDEHTGTHVDAPAHFIPRPGTGYDGEGPAGDVTAEKIPLSQCMGPAAVIDVTGLVGTVDRAGQSPDIEPEHVAAFEAEHGELRSGEIVLFRSGWDEGRYLPGAPGAAYAHDPIILGRGEAWPAPSVATMEYLVERRGVRCVGTDGPSMGSAQAGRGVHVAGLSRSCVFIEALTNLRSLPARGAYFVFAPLKVARGSGAPGRAFALLP